MALEALFASLKIDDVPAVVEAVKKDGAETSGLAANITALVAKCDSADETEALAAFKTVTQLCIECPQAQAFTKDCLSACKCISSACCILSPNDKEAWSYETSALLRHGGVHRASYRHRAADRFFV